VKSLGLVFNGFYSHVELLSLVFRPMSRFGPNVDQEPEIGQHWKEPMLGGSNNWEIIVGFDVFKSKKKLVWFLNFFGKSDTLLMFRLL